MGYPVFTGKLSLFPITGEKILINTINQFTYCIAERDEIFKKALLGSDILLPDGVGIVAASKFLYGKNVQKIAGADLHKYLLDQLEKYNGRCFYLGASEKTLIKIKERIKVEYPSIEVSFYSPPYKPEFSTIDNEKMISAVNEFKPDVLFVGMTTAKQEKWAYAHKEQLNAKIICSIGAVFDFYAGTVKRPNSILIKLGLEWFGRLVREPKRLWKRYLYYGPVFIYFMIIERLKLALKHTS